MLRCWVAVAHIHRDGAGLRQRDVAQDQRRLVLAVLAIDEGPGPAERGGMVRAVHRHLQLGGIDRAGKLDLEVEFCADKDVGPVDRIDRLRRQWRCPGRSQRQGDKEG